MRGPLDDRPLALNDADALEWIAAARGGDFARAWTLSDRIRARTTNQGDPSVPRHRQQIWDGTPFEGRRVLVRCYHGLGDTIQFARYLPRLRAIAREVIVWVQPALLPLLRTLGADLTLLPLHDGRVDAAFDVDIEIMELPYAFRTTLETIPREVPYLGAPGRRGPAPREIAIAWRAGDWDRRRSIAFDAVQPLFEARSLREVRWQSLQLDARPEESHPRLKPHEGETIDHLVEQVANAALVITIDSMPAHLAGALARPVWTLLPHLADWRWMEGREDSPWYPTMRLFRQPRDGAWNEVIERVREALVGALNAAMSSFSGRLIGFLLPL